MKFPQSMASYDNVDVINICDLLECLFPGYFEKEVWRNVGYEEECQAVQKWVAEWDAHVYSRPREDFFINEAVRECAKLGKYLVVVEDMS